MGAGRVRWAGAQLGCRGSPLPADLWGLRVSLVCCHLGVPTPCSGLSTGAAESPFSPPKAMPEPS